MPDCESSGKLPGFSRIGGLPSPSYGWCKHEIARDADGAFLQSAVSYHQYSRTLPLLWLLQSTLDCVGRIRDDRRRPVESTPTDPIPLSKQCNYEAH